MKEENNTLIVFIGENRAIHIAFEEHKSWIMSSWTILKLLTASWVCAPLKTHFCLHFLPPKIG